ncbi:MAG: helix-hairpin-helix domain-containing protein, partial [bacterium]|nr:helix-hairpin-helix domain-containing protein [bacterium]
MNLKKRLGSLVYYLILTIAALFFLFPFLWMFVTSFKVPGTGDKFLYIPSNKINFLEVKKSELITMGLDVSGVSSVHLKQKIKDLYKPGSVPSWQEIELLFSDMLQRSLSPSEKGTLRAKFSPQYDINKVDEKLLLDLGFSKRDAQIIVTYRDHNGEYDNPSNLREIPLLNPSNLRLINRWFVSDPKILLNLDEPTRYRELNWSQIDIQIYREFRKKYGISIRNLRDFEGQNAIKALRVEALDKANKLFFSNKLYTLGNYKKILGHHPRGDDFTFGRAFFNSLIVSVGTALLTILLCTLGGYVFAKKQFTGKTYLYVTFWASMMIPGMMFIVPQYVIITKLEWVNSLQSMIIPHAANIFGLYLMKQ